jgi:hypothetical protein
MSSRAAARRWMIAAALLLPLLGPVGNASSAVAIYAGPTPGRACDTGSLPERTQGRAPAADVPTGRAARGYTCNARQVGHFGGATGGYRVERYADRHGHVCAYYDSSLLPPTYAVDQGTETTGTYAMDMTDPAHPVHTDTLRTPAFQSPHESVRLNQARGLLVADMGYPTTNPGIVDVYDVTADCRHPALQSSTPLGVLGHEGGFAPDGRTFYVASLSGGTLAAVDLTNPKVPTIAWFSYAYRPHGLSISNDGNTLYLADTTTGHVGLTVLDVTQVQRRVLQPDVPVISRLTWPQVSTPQNATPFTEHGHPYLLETDEFGSGAAIGAARIIDIANIRKPFVVSNLRLAVHQAKAQTADLMKDPGATALFQGYRGHYCTVPSRVDPTIIACSFIMSGLRVFNISNPARPVEVAYFNKPLLAGQGTDPTQAGGFAMSAPAYDPARHDIWYSDGNSGFYVVHLTAGAGVRSFAPRVLLPGN